MSQNATICTSAPCTSAARRTVTVRLMALLKAPVIWLAERNKAYRHSLCLEQLGDTARRDLGLPSREWDNGSLS